MKKTLFQKWRHFSPGKKISEVQILGFSPPLFWTAKKSYSNRSRLWNLQFLNFIHTCKSRRRFVFYSYKNLWSYRGSDGPSAISLWCSLNLRQGDTFTLFKNKSLWLLTLNSLQTCKGLNEILQVTFNKTEGFFSSIKTKFADRLWIIVNWKDQYL